MPIDQSTEPAAATNRRTFLTRTAVGGALVTGVALASPLGSMLPFAGAQGTPEDQTTDDPAKVELDDETFSSFAAPLELAAVLGYGAAIQRALLQDEADEWARLFMVNHQATADLLTELVADDAPAPRADVDLDNRLKAEVAAAGDEVALAKVLMDLEDSLAATYLVAVEAFSDSTSARSLAQIAATESQQAALMGSIAGVPVAELTPIEATTEGAINPVEDVAATNGSTTTTTAGDSSTTTSTTAAN